MTFCNLPALTCKYIVFFRFLLKKFIKISYWYVVALSHCRKQYSSKQVSAYLVCFLKFFKYGAPQKVI